MKRNCWPAMATAVLGWLPVFPAHAADVALKRPHARDRDDAISDARAKFDWETQFSLALDPDRARDFREQALAEQRQRDPAATDTRFCTMCGARLSKKDRFCPECGHERES